MGIIAMIVAAIVVAALGRWVYKDRRAIRRYREHLEAAAKEDAD